jgi:hypothetical protein
MHYSTYTIFFHTKTSKQIKLLVFLF